MRVLVAGYYGFGNIGDEAILACLTASLLRLIPEVRVSVVSDNPEATHRQHSLDTVSGRSLPQVIEAADSSDLIILGGGGLFEDYWAGDIHAILSTQRAGLPYYVTFPVLARLLRKKCMIYGVGVGPLTTELGSCCTRFAFRLAHRATVRDLPSAQLVRGLLKGQGQEVEVTADPVYADFSTATQHFATPPNPIAPARPLLGVVLRPWDRGIQPEIWLLEVTDALNRWLARSGGAIWFLPFQKQIPGKSCDVGIAEAVQQRLEHPERTAILSDLLDPLTLNVRLGQCDQVMAMRYHAVLLSSRQRVPLVALAYDPKVTSLASELGLQDFCLPPDRWQSAQILEALERSALQAQSSTPEVLSDLERRALRNAEIAAELLTAPPLPERDEIDANLDELLLLKSMRLDALQWSKVSTEAAASSKQFPVPFHQSQSEVERAVDRLDSLPFRTWELSTLANKVETLARQLQGTSEERERLTQERTELAHRCEILSKRVEILRFESQSIASQLESLDRSLLVRGVRLYWSLVHSLLPPGSLRRRVYTAARRVPGRVYRRISNPFGSSEAPSLVVSAEPESAPATDLASASESALSTPPVLDELVNLKSALAGTLSGRMVVLFSGTQLREDEGQRPTQLALEIAKRNISVVFAYWRWTKDEWCPQDRLDQGIIQVPIDLITQNPEILAGSHPGCERIAFFEFPHPSFFGVLSTLNSHGWITAYDMIDDWEEFHRVGQAEWYDEQFERHLITSVDAIFVINRALETRARGLGAFSVEIVPNGLLEGIDRLSADHQLEKGEVTVGYFGYLAGAWFDWELVAQSAAARPSWRFYLIGYGHNPAEVEIPENVILVGKVPQSQLSGFALHWDVAIIPFKAERLAVGADPIKTYEYLAMGLPVVVTGVFPPEGGESFVTRATTPEGFLLAIEKVARTRQAEEGRRKFAASCTWGHRVEAMLDAIRCRRHRIGEKVAVLANQLI